MVALDVRNTPANTLLSEAAPPEIFLTAEAAAQRRLELKRAGNIQTIPRLRLIGFTLLAAIGVPLHNAIITHNFSWSSFLSFLIVVELYCLLSWLVLWNYYDRVKAVNLGHVFLYLDLFVVAGAVYVTGGQHSWFFWLPLMRVFDQAVHGFRHALSFVFAATAIFIGLWLYLLLVEQRPLDINAEIAKTIFVAVAGFYIALTSRAAEGVRAKLVSAIRFARNAIVQLREKTGALADARVRAEQASQAKSEFLARVSQELRRPATTVIGFAQLLEIGELTPRQADYAARILRSGQELGMMLDEVMDLADVQSGLFRLSPEELSAAQIMEETVGQLWPLAAARGVRLESAAPDADVRMWADRRAVLRALSNTLAHAIRNSDKDEGRVVVSWKQRGDTVRIRMQDSGTGVLSDAEQAILNSVDDAEDEVARLQAMGLGLAFAKSLVVAMNGRVGADLEVGRGTTYWIDVPLVSSAAATPPVASYARRA